MGELIGIPEWLVITLWLTVCFGLYFGLAFHFHRQAHKRLAAKRPNPSREEFMQAMAADVGEVTAAWMWDNLQVYYQPLTPHPDDLLIEDACIDGDDIDMDWPRDFAAHTELGAADSPDWPEDWRLTVRNYARWPEMGVSRLP